MEQKEVSPRADIACSRCRERKTKCTRKKPICESCQTNNFECDYSIPEKRVNHAKLLCRNFERLESQLNSIKGELSSLTALLKIGGSSQQPVAHPASTDGFDDNVSVIDNHKVDITSPASPLSRRIIRGEDDQGDQYHGPGTLLSLCYDLRDAVLSKEHTAPHDANDKTAITNNRMEDASNQGNRSSRHNSSRYSFSANDRHMDLLERICMLASFEPPMEGHEHVPIRLPPKQLLTMALPQFFSQVDYSTDLFVEAHFTANIERIYSRSTSPTDDAWAICFNTVILLVLGSENWTMGNDPLMVTQFAVPLFQAMRAALRQAKFLTTPRLINVQALALLGIAAERYYPAATSTAIFAQACLLARRIGVHQALITSSDICQGEAQQRTKTFISLHLRDKTLALNMSSICWLPSYDHNLSPEIIPSTFADPHIVDRAHLAEMQEQLYRYLAVEPQQQTAKEIASIYQNLEKWATNLDIYDLPFLSLHEAELRLTFLMTRMLAFSCSRDNSRRQAILDDARASCLILLIAYEKHDQGMLNMFQSLRRPSSNTTPDTDSTAVHVTVGAASKSPSAGRLTSLINAFPVMAFFQLAKNILWSSESGVVANFSEAAQADLKLLQDMHTCMVEVNSRAPSQIRASQIECIFEKILELVQLIQHPALDMSTTADIVASGSEVLDPDTSFNTMFGDLPITTALSNTALSNTALSNTNASWDFLSSPFPDLMMNLSSQPDCTDDGRKKRRRTEDIDLSITDESSLSCFPHSRHVGLDFASLLRSTRLS